MKIIVAMQKLQKQKQKKAEKTVNVTNRRCDKQAVESRAQHKTLGLTRQASENRRELTKQNREKRKTTYRQLQRTTVESIKLHCAVVRRQRVGITYYELIIPQGRRFSPR